MLSILLSSEISGLAASDQTCARGRGACANAQYRSTIIDTAHDIAYQSIVDSREYDEWLRYRESQ